MPDAQLKNVRGAASGAAALLILSAGLAGAQTKISGESNCKAPEAVGAAEVGDRAGHAIVLLKFACTWTTPMEVAGQKTKDVTAIQIEDTSGGKGQFRGYIVVVMDNGDKAFGRFSGTDTTKPDHSGTAEGPWSFTGGTGKLKGLKGKGTVKTTIAADGTATDHIEGEYSLPASKPAKK